MSEVKELENVKLLKRDDGSVSIYQDKGNSHFVLHDSLDVRALQAELDALRAKVAGLEAVEQAAKAVAGVFPDDMADDGSGLVGWNQETINLVTALRDAVNHNERKQDMDEMRYWINDDTGRVLASEDCPGRLWSEIDFATYDALVRPGGKAARAALGNDGG